jgi:hypothetical protein
MVAVSCPTDEAGACEAAPAFDGAWYRVKHYYTENSVSELETSCVAGGDNWLGVTCSDLAIASGPCAMEGSLCVHEAGENEPAYWQVWIAYADADATGEGVSYVDADDAQAAAWADLELQADLSTCHE